MKHNNLPFPYKPNDQKQAYSDITGDLYIFIKWIEFWKRTAKEEMSDSRLANFARSTDSVYIEERDRAEGVYKGCKKCLITTGSASSDEWD